MNPDTNRPEELNNNDSMGVRLSGTDQERWIYAAACSGNKHNYRGKYK